MAATGIGGLLKEIPAEAPAGFQIIFSDDKRFDVTNHLVLLAGFLKDFEQVAGLLSGKKEMRIPEMYSGEAFAFLLKVTDFVKENDPKIYLNYLNQTTNKQHWGPKNRELFKGINSLMCVEAANLASYMSFDLPKHVIIWFFAALIRDPKTSVEMIRKMLNTTKLTKETCLKYGLDEKDNVWQTYPAEFDRIFKKTPSQPRKPSA